MEFKRSQQTGKMNEKEMKEHNEFIKALLAILSKIKSDYGIMWVNHSTHASHAIVLVNVHFDSEFLQTSVSNNRDTPNLKYLVDFYAIASVLVAHTKGTVAESITLSGMTHLKICIEHMLLMLKK